MKRKCLHCSKEIDKNAHSRRIYCSNSCRIKAHYERHNLISLGVGSVDDLNKLQNSNVPVHTENNKTASNNAKNTFTDIAIGTTAGSLAAEGFKSVFSAYTNKKLYELMEKKHLTLVNNQKVLHNEILNLKEKIDELLERTPEKPVFMS